MWPWPGQAPPNASQEPQGRKIWPQPPATSGRMHNFQASELGVPTEQAYHVGQPASSRQYHPMDNSGLSVVTETPTEPYENQIWSATPTRTPSTMQSSQLSATISASSEKQRFKEEDHSQPDDIGTFKRPHLNRGGTLPMNMGQEGQKQDMGNDSRYLKPHQKADSLI
jgi:hypothetical protein